MMLNNSYLFCSKSATHFAPNQPPKMLKVGQGSKSDSAFLLWLEDHLDLQRVLRGTTQLLPLRTWLPVYSCLV